MMNCLVDDGLNITNATNHFQPTTSETSTYSCWDYWHHYYYPLYHESYPVYISDRARDKGKEAFEIIKMLKDSRFLKLETVGDFIDLMDKLIKIL